MEARRLRAMLIGVVALRQQLLQRALEPSGHFRHRHFRHLIISFDAGEARDQFAVLLNDLDTLRRTSDRVQKVVPARHGGIIRHGRRYTAPPSRAAISSRISLARSGVGVHSHAWR